jgi:predicted metal-dependent enzyme (double-stranded beta helix superfamily)
VPDYRLIDFLRDLHDLVDAEGATHEGAAGRRLIDGTRRLMEPLCESAGLCGTALERRSARGYSRNLIYHDPGDRFVVTALFWEPGHTTPIHDHGTWGAMCVYKSVLEVECFRRTDDRSRPGFARLEPCGTTREEQGSVSWVLPPDEEIHLVRNASSKTALSLHVYGRDITACNLYDLASGRVESVALAYDNHV